MTLAVVVRGLNFALTAVCTTQKRAVRNDDEQVLNAFEDKTKWTNNIMSAIERCKNEVSQNLLCSFGAIFWPIAFCAAVAVFPCCKSACFLCFYSE